MKLSDGHVYALETYAPIGIVLKVAIIGAGPTGLSAALHLQNISHSCDIDLFEAGPEIGGFSRSFFLFDHIVDLGPHRFFTRDQSIMNFWMNLAGQRCHKVHRQTSIFYDNQFIGYPLAASDLFRALPLKTKSKIISSFLQRSQHYKNDGKNFASTMRFRFGDVLYEIFFKEYTERLWGVPDVDLSAALAYQRIGGFGLAHAVKHAVRGYFKSVEDSFMYPTYGCGQIWETATDNFKNRGGRVFLSSPVTQIAKDRSGYALTSVNGVQSYDHVISTMPMSRFIQVYKESPEWLKGEVQKLQFRSTILVYVEVEDQSRFKDQWIYINSSAIKTGRVTNFSNWGIEYNDRKNTHILCLEYWCSAGDEFWQSTDEALSDCARRDLGALGYVPQSLRRTHVVRLANTYPVITNASEAVIEGFAREMDKHANLQTVGRGGAFKYNNQDHCIEMGIRAARNVVGDTANIWSVNSQNTYHEHALVSTAIPPG